MTRRPRIKAPAGARCSCCNASESVFKANLVDENGDYHSLLCEFCFDRIEAALAKMSKVLFKQQAADSLNELMPGDRMGVVRELDDAERMGLFDEPR